MNAIYNATGVRVHQIPVDPKLLVRTPDKNGSNGSSNGA
jgi:hypothetical protein